MEVVKHWEIVQKVRRSQSAVVSIKYQICFKVFRRVAIEYVSQS